MLEVTLLDPVPLKVSNRRAPFGLLEWNVLHAELTIQQHG